jgi:hypothetical protein
MLNGLGCTDLTSPYWDGSDTTNCGSGFSPTGDTIVGIQNSVNTLAQPTTTSNVSSLLNGINPIYLVLGIVIIASILNSGSSGRRR